MGYVHDTHMSQFVPPAQIDKSAGTWTPTVSSNLVSAVRTAGAASFTLAVPLVLPVNSEYQKGALLKSVDLYYKVATVAATDFATVELDKLSLKVSGTALTGAALSVSLDGGHDTAAKRKATGDHTLTVTLDTPIWVAAGEAVYLVCTVDAAATTVFTLFGARVNWTLRL